MRCGECSSGELRKEIVSTLDGEGDGDLVRFTGVPALVCDTCGEKYFDVETTKALLERAKKERARMTHVLHTFDFAEEAG